MGCLVFIPKCVVAGKWWSQWEGRVAGQGGWMYKQVVEGGRYISACAGGITGALGGCLLFLSLCSSGFQDLLRLNPSSLLMLFGCYFSVMYFICSLKVSMWSNIIPKYFMLFTCVRGLLFRYILTSLISFLLCLARSISCYFCSLNWSLFPLAHFEILLSSAFIWDGFRFCHDNEVVCKWDRFSMVGEFYVEEGVVKDGPIPWPTA